MRLIDADAFLKSEIERCGCVPLIGSCTSDNEIFKFILEKQPTVEAKPVVHGGWIYKSTYYEADECDCSLCGQHMTTQKGKRMNFCPNCGADMRKKVD